MEPDILIGREKPGEFRTDNSDDVAQHWEEDEATVVSKYKPSATRNPDGVGQFVERG